MLFKPTLFSFCDEFFLQVFEQFRRTSFFFVFIFFDIYFARTQAFLVEACNYKKKKNKKCNLFLCVLFSLMIL